MCVCTCLKLIGSALFGAVYKCEGQKKNLTCYANPANELYLVPSKHGYELGEVSLPPLYSCSGVCSSVLLADTAHDGGAALPAEPANEKACAHRRL